MFTKGAIEHMRREAVTDRRFQLDRLELAALAKMEDKDEAFKLAFDYGRGMERRLSKTRPYFPITAQQFMAYQKYLLRRDLTPAECTLTCSSTHTKPSVINGLISMVTLCRPRPELSTCLT